VFFLDRWGGRIWGRALVLGLAAISILLVWAETIAGQSFPDLTPNPLLELSLPRLLAGDIARNLGMLLRLHGPASLLPLAVVVLVLGLLIAAGLRHSSAEKAESVPRDQALSSASLR